jgi:hypothetical protein
MLLQVLALAGLAGPLDSAVVRDIEVGPGLFGAAFGYRSVIGPLVERGYRCIVVDVVAELHRAAGR